MYSIYGTGGEGEEADILARTARNRKVYAHARAISCNVVRFTEIEIEIAAE